MAAVFELKIPAPEKLVLLAMADHARDDGTGCYPSIDLLARKTSQTRRGVQRIMRRLEDDYGLIKPSHISRGRRATEYQITLDNRDPGSLFGRGNRDPGNTQPRPAAPPTATLSTSNRDPGSPESLGTTPEPSLNLFFAPPERPKKPNGAAERHQTKTTEPASPSSRRAAGGKRATALSEDFTPTLNPEMLAFARTRGVANPGEEFEAFLDHHRSKGSAMKDWEAAWRTWCRNYWKFQGGKNGHGNRPTNRGSNGFFGEPERDWNIQVKTLQNGGGSKPVS